LTKPGYVEGQNVAIEYRWAQDQADDMLDAAGEIQEYQAGVEDYLLAKAVWREAIARWPKAVIILRQGARVVLDSSPAAGSEMKRARLCQTITTS
jgi:predicted kinase